jgi:pimeloyl-ACP methyl ester carboxylesterase
MQAMQTVAEVTAKMAEAKAVVAVDRVGHGRSDKRLQALIPGSQGQPHQVLPNANHFTQDDAPAELSATIVDLMQRG